MSKTKTYIKGHKVTHKHIFKMTTTNTTNLFLMNCGECLTLDELRFIISNDLRVVKRDVDADVEADVEADAGTSDVPEETNEVPVIEEQEEQQEQQHEAQYQENLRNAFSSTIVRNAHPVSTSQEPQEERQEEQQEEQPESHPICCICQEETEVACHPENCHSSHTMCYPECVSKYAYVMRIQQGRVSCGHCRSEFQNVVVEGLIVPIPELSSVTRRMLPSHLRNDSGCERCWGIYNPIPSPEYFYHNKRQGHRGRHRTMPLQYQQIVEVTDGAERNENN